MRSYTIPPPSLLYQFKISQPLLIMYDGSNSLMTRTRLVVYLVTRSLGLSVRGVMVGRESLDLDDSLRVTVVGAPSWASFLVAPLGPDSRLVLVSADLEDDDVVDDDDDDDDDEATSATTTSSA